MWFICLANVGRCSQICRPSRLVAIGLNCPPVGAPGFMSNKSIVAGPPLIHSMMQALFCFLSRRALANRLLVNAIAGTAIAEAPARCDRKWRRVMPRGTSKRDMGCSEVDQFGKLIAISE